LRCKFNEFKNGYVEVTNQNICELKSSNKYSCFDIILPLVGTATDVSPNLSDHLEKVLQELNIDLTHFKQYKLKGD